MCPKANIEQRRCFMLIAKPLQSVVPRTCVLYRFFAMVLDQKKVRKVSRKALGELEARSWGL